MKKILLLVLLLTGIKYTYAQSAHLKFDHFTVKDGLPERTIMFMKQDDQGYLWMGTQNGLLRYDGYKPKIYRFGTDKDAIYTSCSVESMVTDNYKNLWVSTYGNGLFRYDRTKDTFIQYKYPQKAGEKITKDQNLALVDRDNNLWAFASAFPDLKPGLVRFNQQENRFESFNFSAKGAHHLDAKDVFYIMKSADGTLWLGTGDGLFYYDYHDDQFHLYPIKTDIKKQDSVFNIYEAPSKKGELWLISCAPGTSKIRLVQLNTQTKKISYYDHGADKQLDSRNDTVNTMLEDSKKRLWLATQNGLLLLNRDTKVFTKYLPADTDKDNSGNHLHYLTEAKNGTLWITTGRGLLNFDPISKQFQRYTNIPDDPTSIAGNSINKLLVDRSGTVFASVRKVGLVKNNPLTSVFSAHIQNRNKPQSYPGGLTRQLAAGSDGSVFLTNPNGIYKWKPGTDEFTAVYKIKKTDGVPDAIMMGNDDLLYFNTRGDGLQVYNVKTAKLQKYVYNPQDSSSINSNFINIIKQDHFGKIWLGTDGNGICSLDPATRKFKRYPYITNNGSVQSKGKLDDERVMSIYEDKAGTLWVGTNLGGLNRFDRKTGTFKSYLFTKSAKVFSVLGIAEDKAGKLWIGTYLNGAFEFDPKTESYLRHVDENNGLLFNSINSIAADDKGMLWITSERGLTRLNPRDLSLRNYRGSEIFSESTFTSDINDIVLQHGVFVMALNNGIAEFDPAGLAANTTPPIVHIERVGYSDPSAATDSSTILQAYGSHGIELPYNQNRITFNYIALHFANPSQNKYAYILEGFDKHWIQAGTQRSVTYTNLTPGTYTFRVKASNSDGVWNNEGDSFLVIVDSPLWQRWWAWVIYIVVFILLVSGFIAYRSRQLRKENQELEEKVTERTHQLSNANKELSEQQEEITTQRDKLAETVTELKSTQQQLVQSEKLASLGELTAGIAHEIQNPLNFVNNFAEVSVELVDELADELTSEKRDAGLEEELIADLKQNLEKITHHGKRADGIVKNMLQHSRANSGEAQPTDINALADEYLRLAYHGLRAKEKDFNSATVINLDSALPKVNVIPQDIGRVLLNLFNNAFYAVHQKKLTAGTDYKPEVSVTTSAEKGQVIIKVKDNGNGIPDAIKDKIMQPFFTTKPTGEGTGLGLSLSYDIVVKGHGGSIQVNSVEGKGSEFIIQLPINQIA